MYTYMHNITTHVYLDTQSFMLLRSSVKNKIDVKFTMVYLGYKNNAMVSNFHRENLGAIKRDFRGLSSCNIVLKVH